VSECHINIKDTNTGGKMNYYYLLQRFEALVSAVLIADKSAHVFTCAGSEFRSLTVLVRSSLFEADLL